MIDPQNESLIPLAEVRKHIPSSRPGKRLNIATIWRWATSGVRGAVLETISIGNSRYTSHEALARFVAECSGADPLHRPIPKKRTTAQARRDHLRAERELDAAGIK